MKAPGFMVWNPGGRLPSRIHNTYERAEAERARLASENPEAVFFVMSPVTGTKKADVAKAYSDGKGDGLSDARDQIMRAEKVADQLGEQIYARRRIDTAVARLVTGLDVYVQDVHAVIAWFEGFAAAQRSRDHIPGQTSFNNLLASLRGLHAANRTQFDVEQLDEEIPF